jgi:PAS domain S-box-containing protein
VVSSTGAIVMLDEAGTVLYLNPTACAALGLVAGEARGRPFLPMIAAGDRGAFERVLSAAVPGRTRHAVFNLVGPDGERRELEPWTVCFEADGRPITALVLYDSTEAGRRERTAGALVTITSSLALQQPLEVTLQQIAARALESTETVAAAVVLMEDNPPTIRFVGSAGALDPDWGPTEAAWRAGVDSPTMRALREDRVVVAVDARGAILADPRYAPAHAEVEAAPWSTVVISPLAGPDGPIGVLTGYFARDSEPSASEVGLLEAIANQAATVVHNATLFAEAQATAALAERQRLAHQLHDSVSQVLFGIALGTKTAISQLGSEPHQATAAVDYVLSLAEAGLAEMRALLFELRPDSLEEEGLVAALTKQAAAIRARYSVDVREDLCPEPSLGGPAKEGIYRVAQEALRNATRHAGAQHVALKLRSGDRGVELEVRDDGRGFDTEKADNPTGGLALMRTRAARLEGELEVVSTPGEGTVVRLLVPGPRPRVVTG